MTSSALIANRLHNEHLDGTFFEKAEDVVKWFGVVQSQDFAGAKWWHYCTWAEIGSYYHAC